MEFTSPWELTTLQKQLVELMRKFDSDLDARYELLKFQGGNVFTKDEVAEMPPTLEDYSNGVWWRSAAICYKIFVETVIAAIYNEDEKPTLLLPETITQIESTEFLRSEWLKSSDLRDRVHGLQEALGEALTYFNIQCVCMLGGDVIRREPTAFTGEWNENKPREIRLLEDAAYLRGCTVFRTTCHTAIENLAVVADVHPGVLAYFILSDKPLMLMAAAIQGVQISVEDVFEAEELDEAAEEAAEALEDEPRQWIQTPGGILVPSK